MEQFLTGKNAGSDFILLCDLATRLEFTVQQATGKVRLFRPNGSCVGDWR